MSLIRLNLDDATLALLEQAAAANGVSVSHWAAELIRKYAAHEWPGDCKALAGRFADFPLADAEHHASSPADVDRLAF